MCRDAYLRPISINSPGGRVMNANVDGIVDLIVDGIVDVIVDANMRPYDAVDGGTMDANMRPYDIGRKRLTVPEERAIG